MIITRFVGTCPYDGEMEIFREGMWTTTSFIDDCPGDECTKSRHPRVGLLLEFVKAQEIERCDPLVAHGVRILSV